MITNITTQSFADFAKTVEEKTVVPPQRQRLDILADYYTNRVSNNETELITKYAASLVSGGQPHTPDPRLYMRRDLLGLVQDSYALGIADALVDLQDVQFSYEKTDAEFALSPDDKLQRDIQKLQRDIAQSQQIVRQTKTLNQYTNTLQSLQQQAQALNNTQATQTLNQLSKQLDSLKTNNTVRGVTKLVNQQIQKGQTQQSQAQATVNQQIAATGQPNTQDYLVKRAIEEKLKYLENRRDSLASTPPVVLDEDADFFRWYADKRLVPIANRYQQGLQDKNNEAKDIATKYIEEINKGTTTQAAKGTATDKIVRKLLSIEDSSTPSPKDKKRPIKRVQRVVATELAIAYNVGRLKAYMKAGVQYVTISTSMYSPDVCQYCDDTAAKTEQEPIKISSLLKNAYRNQGFNKDIQPKVSDLRYLPNHPYCFCFYKPHPKRDPDDKEETGGIYADPNSWKFILGAGLGVSLVFLAFALTTGRKISVPSVIPTKLPSLVPIKQAIPEVVTDIVPETIPVRAITPSQLIPLPLLQRSIQNLTKEQQSVYVDIISDTTIPIDIRLAQVYAQAADDLITVNTKDFLTLETQATQVTATKGVVRAFINKQVDKIQQTYDRNTQALATRIAQEQAKAQAIDPQNPTKSAIAGVSNSVKNINKTYIQSQLKSIQTTKQIALESYNKVADKTKSSDLKYKAELQQKLDTLSSMEQGLLEQKQVLGDIQEYLNDLVVPTKAVVRKTNKAVIQQQLSNTTAAVDRLIDGSGLTTIVDKTMQTTRLQQAQEEYKKLLELLVDLSPAESRKYTKRVQDLNRRIKNAQGIELKRFTGHMVGFSSMVSQKYSC